MRLHVLCLLPGPLTLTSPADSPPSPGCTNSSQRGHWANFRHKFMSPGWGRPRDAGKTRPFLCTNKPLPNSEVTETDPT